MTLSKALVRSQSLPVQAALVAGGSLFIALAAQVSVPMIPVPMTLQTLAVLLVGFAFGARLGVATLIAYLAEGAMGLPVFAQGLNGIAFFGPTGGFLVGFVAMAAIAGYAADRGVTSFAGTAATGLLASALLYIPGVAWAMSLAKVAGIDTAKWGADNFGMIWQYYMQPFLIGDAVKAVLAALIVTGGWALLKNRKA
ncbi:MAG TPA: biotin transporter BioY [Albidovulum sp.]|uniref:biotin transporter BioY n=1 Tax=Albidovulum sp. TaxID=1872424 RepID=UPI002B531807|nr:biotin transporter BioY [Albidovulum sp.]